MAKNIDRFWETMKNIRLFTEENWHEECGFEVDSNLIDELVWLMENYNSFNYKIVERAASDKIKDLIQIFMENVEE